MNKAIKNVAMIAGLLLLAGCNAPSSNQPAPQGDLVGARIGAPFRLINQDGKPVQWSDFAGQYRLVYFGYTYCPDVCPLDLTKIIAGLRLLEKSDPALAARIQPIFITVDPARDTPEALKTYVSAFHPRLIGLTGTTEQIEKVKKDFVVVASKKGDPKATQDYLVSHTRTPFLFGPDGAPIALVPTDADAAGEKTNGEMVRAFLKTWVK